MRGNRDIFSGKSICNRKTFSRQEHRISEYRIKISSKLLFTFLSDLVLVATAIYDRWTSSLCGKRWVIPTLIYNSVGVKKHRGYNLQIVQTDIWEKNLVKNEKTKSPRATRKQSRSTFVKSKEKTPRESPQLKRNEGLNTWDRANIRKIIPTWPRASLFRFHQTALQDCSSRSLMAI